MPLGKRAEFGDARYAGVDISYAHNIAEHMQVPSCNPQQQLFAAAPACCRAVYITSNSPKDHSHT